MSLPRLSALGAMLLIAGCGGGGGGSSISAAQLTQGMIHQWKFAGNANDSVGGLSSTPIGPVTYTTTPIGQGIVFNGSTTGISLPATGDTQFQGSFSVSVWASLKTYTGTLWSAIIFDGDDRNGLDPYAIQVDPNGALVFLVCGSQGDQVQSTMALNTFEFITGTYDQAAQVLSLYVNGKLVDQKTKENGLTPVVALDPSASPGLGIGTNNAFGQSEYNFGWNGVVEDLRLYNRALSAAEVQALYNQR